jgi:hypothetical protein
VRRIIWLALAGCAVAAHAEAESATTPRSDPGANEVYAATGFSYYGSDRRVLAGAGGGPGYRRHLTARFAAYAEVQYLVYLGNAFRGVVGASYAFKIGPFDPLVGVQASIYGGDRVEVISSEQPSPPPALAWAGQVRLAPLRFSHDPFTVMALYGDIGLGVDAKTRALAISVSLLEIGVRF